MLSVVLLNSANHHVWERLTNFLSFSLRKHAETPAAPSAGCATACFFLSLSFPCKPEPGFCAIFKEQAQGMSVLREVIGPACASI